MDCRNARQHLNTLCDGERLEPGALYLEIAGHALGCAGCRTTWRRLRRMRQVVRHLPEPAPPPGLKARVLASLPPIDAMAELPVTRRRFWNLLPAGRWAFGVALLLALLVVSPWKGRRGGAAAIAAAVQRANTWHLQGWKLHEGQRVPWEIWGRRSPFFYREQVGEEMTLDDGRQRLEIVSAGPNGGLFAVRMASSGEPDHERWFVLTSGAAWPRMRPWRQSADTIIFRTYDGGMRAPGSLDADCYTIDRRTWLPVLYEYRHDANTREQVVEQLHADYDVAIPASVMSAQLPRGVRVVDALSASPEGSVPTENTQRIGGLTLQITPLAIDPAGLVLARARCWLGDVRLGAAGTPTTFGIEIPIPVRTGERRGTGFRSDSGTPYVKVASPFLNGPAADQSQKLLLFAPLEPLPHGAPLPRSLVLNLDVTPRVWRIDAQFGSMADLPLFHQEFDRTLPLPDQPTAFDLPDHLPPPHGPRSHVPVRPASIVTVEACVDQERSNHYMRQYLRQLDLDRARGIPSGGHADLERASYWMSAAVAASPPATTYAQFLRLSLARMYQQAGDLAREAAVLRQVIAVSRRHPELPGHYRREAEAALAHLGQRGQDR